MSTPRFDLVDIAQTLKRRGRFILLITLLAALAGALFYMLAPRRYKSIHAFFVTNPLYADRNNIFRTGTPQFIDWFGDEDDVDRVTAIARSEVVKAQIIQNLNLIDAYKLDTSRRGDANKLAAIFKRNYNVKRTEYQNLEISYTDEDPLLAAQVANEAARVVDLNYRDYYNRLKNNVIEAMQAQLTATNRSIDSLTDTLVSMRQRYGIYDLISPARENLISGQLSRSGSGENFARGLEEIQNVEALKDQLVTDRARYYSMINEFATGSTSDKMPLIKTISEAYPPLKPVGLGLLLTMLACALAGAFFAALWALLSAYFRTLTSVQR